MAKSLLYTPPKLYDKGKYWYITYWFQVPNANHKQEIRIKKGLNRIKNLRERRKTGNEMVVALHELLKEGYNPFVDQPTLLKERKDFDVNNSNGSFKVSQNKESTVLEPTKSKPISGSYNLIEHNYTVRSAFKYAIENLKNGYEPPTLRDFKGRISQFLEWATENEKDKINIKDFTKKDANSYLNSVGRKLSKTSVNNFRAMLSMVLAKLADDEIIERNFIIEIKKKKAKPQKNKPYTKDQIKKIKKYLIANDPLLYFFTQMITYTFLRNREVLRLTVGDIDLKNRRIAIKTKTAPTSYVLIIDHLVPILEKLELDKQPKDHCLITHYGLLGYWDSELDSKVNFFGKRFRKVKKALGFDNDHTIYSLRHTFALDLFHNFIAKGLTEREAVLKMLPITRHTEEKGLRNYLRDIGGMMPKDYSKNYTIDF